MKRPLALICIIVVFASACATARYEPAPRTSRPAALSEGGYAVASWYGPDFHGRPTSSGEIFNMHANTCAHREFPFGTRLRVTNVSNGRSAGCIVNDRGPFVEGRDIDLSYAVARQVEMIGTGTARVRLDVEGRDESYIRQVKVQTGVRTGPFAIQIGSFSENINAIRLKHALALRYGNVYIQEAEVKGSTFYRVRIGNYENMSGAMPVAEKLGQEGYQTVVMKADVKI